jgi:hypothetical protein
MTTLKRFDVNKLTIGTNVKETPQGFLVIPAFTARTGIQSYRMADGTTLKEFRPEEEVFSDASMSSLRTAAVTDGHPKEMVNPENAHELMLGHTDGVIEKVQDGDEKFLKTHLVITHKKAIDAIRAGKAQLSNGYNVDLDFTEGEHNGQRYDAVQRNIVNNHIAIVWKARAGEKASLRLDEKDAILLTNDENKDEPNKKELKQMKLKIGDKEFEVADEIGNAVKAEMAKMKSDLDEMSKHKNDSEEAEKTIATLTTEKTALTAKVDSLESDVEKLKKEPKLDEEEVSKRVKETIEVRDNAEKILDKETLEKLDSMSNEEIKIAVIKADSPSVDEEKLKNDSYVNARYDHICENFVDSKKKNDSLGKEIVKGREENNDGDEDYKSPEEIRLENMRKDSLGPNQA